MPTRQPTIADALQALGLQAARWQAVLDTARDAILAIDRNGTITLFNAAAEAMFGYDAGETIGRNVRMLMPSPYSEEHDSYLESYHRTHVPKAIGRVRQVRAQRKTGEVFPIELSVSQTTVADEVTYCAIIRDVSEHVELRARLQQRERLADVGAVTASIVHDLGNPIAGLSMLVQRLALRLTRDRTAPIESIGAIVDEAASTVARVVALTDGFRNFLREQRLELETVAVPEFLGSVRDYWAGPAAEHNIRFTVETPDDRCTLRADREKLRRVLDNIVQNAVEAIGDGPGDVHITGGCRTSDRVRISIHDSGPGFPPSVSPFTLFQTTKPNGTGLGLSIAKRIVDAHGGQIFLATNHPRGTVFTLDLPQHGPRV